MLIEPDGTQSPLKVGDALLISAGGEPRPASIDAPLVFIGYGLHLPDGPMTISPAWTSRARSRW